MSKKKSILPQFLFKAILSMLRKTIKNKADFDFKDLNVLSIIDKINVNKWEYIYFLFILIKYKHIFIF